MRTKIKKVMVYVCMAQDTEWACQKGEEVVDTLQILLAVSVTVCSLNKKR